MQHSNSSFVGPFWSPDQNCTVRQPFKFAVNSRGRNKDWNFKTLNGNFCDVEGTIEDVIAQIKQGHAICAGLLNNQWRSKANFSGSFWVLSEIDNAALLKDNEGNVIRDQDGKGVKIYEHQLTLEEAIEHPFIKQFCSLIYTTPSHSPDWHRFRLVFQLPEFIADIETYEAIVQFLLEHLPHDPACKDGVRIFYGNTEAEFPLINLDARLPVEWVQHAIAQAEQVKQTKAEQEKLIALKRQQFCQLAQSEGWNTDKLIQQALGCIPSRTPGSGNYDECKQVLMALKDYYGATEAEVIAQSWSPSIKGTTWNIAQKIRSFRRKGITIGTLFYIASKHEFRFPQRRKSTFDPREPDRDAYDAFVKEQEERSRLEEIEVEHHQYTRLKAWLKRTQQRIENQGMGKPSIRRMKAQVEMIHYLPGKLPRVNDYAKPPQILYKPEQLPQILREAIALGWRDILDTTQTGGGKSHLYSSLSPSQLGIQQSEESENQIHRVWLLSHNHRNPSTESAEQNYTDLPVRNSGFVRDEKRQTPLGNAFLRWAKPGEQPETQGNCHLTTIIHKAASKGITIANETAGLNPFCAMCKHKDYCKESSGNGFGFRFERSEALRSSIQIRASINSLPDPATYATYKGDVAILDEALMQLNPIQTIKANLGDFDTQWAELEANLPEAHALLNPLRQALRPLVSGEIRQHYGFDDVALRSQLPQAPKNFVQIFESIRELMLLKSADLTQEPEQIQTKTETAAIAQLKGKVARRSQKLEKLEAEYAQLQPIKTELRQGQYSLFGTHLWTPEQRRSQLDQLTKLPKEIAALRNELDELQTQLAERIKERELYQRINRSQFRDVSQRVNALLDSVPNQWLIPFLEVWSELVPGALRVNGFGELFVTLKDDRHNEILNALKSRIYLDATATPSILSLYRQTPMSEILWIAQDLPEADNLTVVWVQGLGLAGKQRSNSCNTRINALLTELRAQYPDLTVFDWQGRKAETNADGHWFSDYTRGTNEFSDRSAIAAVGLPMPNTGTFYDLWLTLTQSPELEALPFQEFYTHQIDAEILQAIGRLRATRRRGEKLTFFLIGDANQSRSATYQLPEFLNSVIQQARDITINAANPTERTWITISELVKRWWSKTGELPTQNEVEAESGISQSSISKIAQQFIGGWKQLKKIFMSLLDPCRQWNIFEPVPQEVNAIAQTFLPAIAQLPSEVAAEELSTLLKSIRWHDWQLIAAYTDDLTRSSLISTLIGTRLKPADSRRFGTG